MLHLLIPSNLGALVSWALLGVLIASLLRNYFNKGLNNYPAPSYSAFTDFWRLLVVARGLAHAEYLELHNKIGDVVRLGPNALSFSDPKAVKVIYGLSNKLPKVHLIQSSMRLYQWLTVFRANSIQYRCKSRKERFYKASSGRQTKTTMQNFVA